MPYYGLLAYLPTNSNHSTYPIRYCTLHIPNGLQIRNTKIKHTFPTPEARMPGCTNPKDNNPTDNNPNLPSKCGFTQPARDPADSNKATPITFQVLQTNPSMDKQHGTNRDKHGGKQSETNGERGSCHVNAGTPSCQAHLMPNSPSHVQKGNR